MVDDQTRFTIGELAAQGGVSRRTVRYYVRRGLLPRPLGTGRGPHYTDEHLDVLVRIRDRQRGGASLEAIAAELAGASAVPSRRLRPIAAPALTRQPWTRWCLAPGVELHVAAVSPLSAMQIELARRLVEELMPDTRHTRMDRGDDE